LQGLIWWIMRSNLDCADLFFSPHLREVYISTSESLMQGNFETLPNLLPAIASAISIIPTSTLQLLFVDHSNRGVPWAYFNDPFSSVALRCGPLLTEFTSPVPLSDTAVNHLIHLPHLRTWRVEGPPPRYSASPLPHVFPPLIKFTLAQGAACGWLSLLRCLEHGDSSTHSTTPLSKVKESLECLKVEELDLLGPTIDVSFAVTIKIFRNLAHLDVGAFCYEKGRGRCIFKLKNNDVVALAMALAQLESLLLGYPCFENTCATTVACLLPISVYCVKLRKLEIHFNTTNIVGDLRNSSGDPRFQELLLLPRCPLSCLEVFQIPLTLDEPGFGIVVNWMVNIFPSLKSCEGVEDIWFDISDRITILQAMRIPPGASLAGGAFDFPFI